MRHADQGRFGEALDLRASKGDRPVFPGGVAIMSAHFQRGSASNACPPRVPLRLGVLYDLLGRFITTTCGIRRSPVFAVAIRWRATRSNGSRPRTVGAGANFRRATPERDRCPVPVWACRLHEIGISVAHNAYHKRMAPTF